MPTLFFCAYTAKGIICGKPARNGDQGGEPCGHDWRSLVSLGFLLLALFATLPPSALALTASQVYEQVKDSVVVVKAYDQTG